MESSQNSVVQYALEPGAVEVRETQVPEVGDNDVVLHVGAVSVCGSDIHQAHNTHSWPVNVPVILGHEFGGTIAAKGKNVKDFKEGDRVVSETAAEICSDCIMCRSGNYNLCSKRKGFGYGIDGAMTSYVKTPARCLHNIPDTLPFEYACLTEPCSVAYNSVCMNATIRPGDLAVVIGPGTIGLLCARLAIISGANPVIVAGLSADKDRFASAMEIGVTRTVNVEEEDLEAVVRSYSPDGADFVCEASGATKPLETAVKIVCPNGQITKVGWSPQETPVDLNPLVQKNVKLQGSFSHYFPIWEKVIRLLDQGLLMPEKIVGLKTKIEDWENAFEAMHSGKVIKSVLLPN